MIKNKTFSTSFIVLPKHCNYMYPLIFGGAFMAELDLAAASLVRRIVSESKFVDNAVTYKADFEFVAPSYSGDLIIMDAVATEVKGKHIVITVTAKREFIDTNGTLTQKLVANAKLVFVTRMGEKYTNHSLLWTT